jgi:hypothetical protein
MAIFSTYDAMGRGFNMPISAADGYVIGSSAGTVSTLLFDDGFIAIFSVIGSPYFNQVGVAYNISGDTITIFDVVYAKNGNTVLEILVDRI